jgi:hypothetical protein
LVNLVKSIVSDSPSPGSGPSSLSADEAYLKCCKFINLEAEKEWESEGDGERIKIQVESRKNATGIVSETVKKREN